MPATHAHATHASAAKERRQKQHQGMTHYSRLLLMTALSFAAMYGLMYAMVDRLDNVFNHINQVYMAGLMAAAMVVIELGVMGSMYPNRKLNAILIAASVAALIACWALTRTQAGVGDQQFLRSMIPHHAGAVLMCENAPIRDREVRDLCTNIVTSQQSEIRQMKAKLEQLSR